MLTIVAMLSSDSIFFAPKHKPEAANAARQQLAMPEGDHLTILNVYKSFVECRESKKQWCFDHYVNYRTMKKVLEVRKQLLEYFRQMPAVEQTAETEQLRREWAAYLAPERVLRCIVAAFFMHVALRQPTGRYTTLKDNKEVYIHPTSSLFGKKPPCVVYNELVLTSKNYIRDVSAININWLVEVAPRYFSRWRDANNTSNKTSQ